jgi:hypothetical protein
LPGRGIRDHTGASLPLRPIGQPASHIGNAVPGKVHCRNIPKRRWRGRRVPISRAASGGPPASSLPDTPRHTGNSLSRSGSSTRTAVGTARAVLAAPASRPLGGHKGQGRDRPEPGRSTTPRRRPTTSLAARDARHETNGRRATGRGLLRGSVRCRRAPSVGPHVPSVGPHVHVSLLPSAPATLPLCRAAPIRC